DDLLRVEEGSLYPALQRLLKAGLLRAEWDVSPTNRRVRTYRLTPRGHRHLARELSRFEQMLKGVTRHRSRRTNGRVVASRRAHGGAGHPTFQLFTGVNLQF